jgi:hypothetical protein
MASSNAAVEKQIPAKRLDELVTRLRRVAGENLQSVILYGSAAGGEFHPEFSNLNLLCILRETSIAALNALVPVVQWWNRHKHPVPLLLTREELQRSADVFSIEFLDMQQRHRVLFGDDVLAGLHVPMNLHRAQVEYELREKLILLREHALLAAGDRKRLWDVLLHSLPAFTTLFRHTLIALGDPAPDSQRAALQALSGRISFDGSAFLQVLDVREYKVNRKQLDVTDVFARYLAAAQQATAAVDTMLDSAGSR